MFSAILSLEKSLKRPRTIRKISLSLSLISEAAAQRYERMMMMIKKKNATLYVEMISVGDNRHIRCKTAPQPKDERLMSTAD